MRVHVSHYPHLLRYLVAPFKKSTWASLQDAASYDFVKLVWCVKYSLGMVALLAMSVYWPEYRTDFALLADADDPRRVAYAVQNGGWCVPCRACALRGCVAICAVVLHAYKASSPFARTSLFTLEPRYVAPSKGDGGLLLRYNADSRRLGKEGHTENGWNGYWGAPSAILVTRFLPAHAVVLPVFESHMHITTDT